MAAGGLPVGFSVMPEVAEEVGHRGGTQLPGRSQRHAADGAKLLLELAFDVGVDGEVAAVVGGGGEFVDR